MTLRLIQGGSPEDPGDGPTRRTVRRRPPARDPVTEILERLDEEPTGDGRQPAGRPRIPEQRRPPRHDEGPLEPPARPGRPTAALLLLLYAALAATAYFGLDRYGDRQTGSARRQATAAAEQACVAFVSVSAASVDGDLQRILAATTGDFRDEFSRGRSRARAAVVENGVESRGTVLRAALLTGDRRHATVLVAVDATVRTTHAPDGRLSHHRIQVDLVREDGRWLVSRLRFVA